MAVHADSLMAGWVIRGRIIFRWLSFQLLASFSSRSDPWPPTDIHYNIVAAPNALSIPDEKESAMDRELDNRICGVWCVILGYSTLSW